MKSGLRKITANKTIDARGLPCPEPLRETEKGMAGLAAGQILELLASDAGTKVDMIEWCQQKGYEYLGYITHEGYDSIYIKK